MTKTSLTLWNTELKIWALLPTKKTLEKSFEVAGTEARTFSSHEPTKTAFLMKEESKSNKLKQRNKISSHHQSYQPSSRDSARINVNTDDVDDDDDVDDRRSRF